MLQLLMNCLFFVAFVSLCFIENGKSTEIPSFIDLCRFEGLCLNCSEGGCEDMCNFYDNNCCVNSSTSVAPSLKRGQFSCVRKFPDMYDLHLDCRGSFDGVYGVYMVTKCSDNWQDHSIKTNCEKDDENNILSNVPVYDHLHEIVTYKNMYCAFCNNVNLRHLRFWKFDLMCDDAQETNITDYETDFMYGKCFIRLIYKTHRMCAMDVIESCQQTKAVNPSLKHKCESGLTQNVYVWRKERTFRVYKNEFCAKCNFESGDLQCWAFQAFSCWPLELPTYTSVQAMVNLNLDGRGNRDTIELFNDTCGEGILYDPFSRTCLNTTCLPSQNTCVSGECYLVEVAASEVMFRNDTSLYFMALGLFLQDGRYFIENANVHICLNQTQFYEFEILKQTTHRSTGIPSTDKTSTTFLNESTSDATPSESTTIESTTDISLGSIRSVTIRVVVVSFSFCLFAKTL